MYCECGKPDGTVHHRSRTTSLGRGAPRLSRPAAIATGARSLACNDTHQHTDQLDLSDARLLVDLGDTGQELRVLMERGEISVGLVTSPAPFVDHTTDGCDGVIIVVEQGPASPGSVYAALEDTRDHEDWAG